MNQEKALELALTLAITAPNDPKAKEASAMAEHIATNMSAEQVESIKLKVQEKLGLEEPQS
tara:strand:- start:1152 stop:1334 length:183 start_codon:yes stop_codon:yes gene_type:complete